MPNFGSVSFFVWPGGVTQINKKIHKYTRIQVSLGISSTDCLPHVDFDKYTYIQVKLGISYTGCSPLMDFDKDF